MAKFQKKEFKERLKKGTLTEPLCLVIDTEKSIKIDEKHIAIIGTKLDKNFNPEMITDKETGEQKVRKLAVIVDGAPQREGIMSAYYRNIAPYETREMLIAQALDPNNPNPATRIGASVIMYHEAVSENCTIFDEESNTHYPVYKASRYCHRAGITPEEASKRMFYGIRVKLNIKDRGTDKQRVSLDGYDLRKQIKINNIHQNKEAAKKALEDIYDHIYKQYKDPEYNKGSVVLSFFTHTADGIYKRIGKMTPVGTDKKEWKYNDAPLTYTTYDKNEKNKSKREVRPKEDFVNDTLKFIERTISKFKQLDLVITPKYSMDLDNLAKEKFRMEVFLIDKLSSGFHDAAVLTSPNRHYKYFQFYQYEPQPAPYNIYNDTKTEEEVMTFEEYEKIKQNSSSALKTEQVQQTHFKENPVVYTTFDDEEDPFSPSASVGF